MSDLPKSVEFHEEGPREGFQIEKELYPIEQRAALIDAIAAAGLKQIQVGSFVNPKKVPTMADTAELFQKINKRSGTRYTALWLNKKGFERAVATPNVDLDGKMIFYLTDAFSIKNNNAPLKQIRDQQMEWFDIYAKHGVKVEHAYFLTAWGCNYQGDVPVESLLDQIKFLNDYCVHHDHAMPTIYLADTMGWATPEGIKRRISAILEVWPELKIATHLHDTRGAGPANFYAALEMGIRDFDSSIAGLGGCPFAESRDHMGAGNICTEDMVFMCHEMGIETGIDLEQLIEASRMAESIIGRKLNGRLMHAGSLSAYR